MKDTDKLGPASMNLGGVLEWLAAPVLMIDAQVSQFDA